jgi:hypothetical protein
MKRRLTILALTCALLAPAAAQAKGGNFGLGIMVGDPLGLSGKLYLNNQHAFAFGVGEYLVRDDGLGAHIDYLWHPWPLVPDPPLELYIGVGGRIADHDRGNDRNDDFHLGVRMPFGLLLDFRRKGKVPIDVFVEVVPLLDIILEDDDRGHDGIDIDIDAAIGVRYYF